MEHGHCHETTNQRRTRISLAKDFEETDEPEDEEHIQDKPGLGAGQLVSPVLLRQKDGPVTATPRA